MSKKLEQKFTIKGEITATIRDAKTGKIKRVYKHTNLVTTVGRTVLARRLSGNTTYTGEISHGALGSDNTAPVNADTALGTEVYRNATASATFSTNIAYVTFFYNATEVSGTFAEFGNFIDGSGVADSGQMFTHVLVSWTKSNTETLTVDCKYTIT